MPSRNMGCRGMYALGTQAKLADVKLVAKIPTLLPPHLDGLLA